MHRSNEEMRRMNRNAGSVLVAVIAGIAMGAPARAQEFLSNTPVSASDAGALFAGAAPTLWATRTEDAGDVRVRSTAFRGVTGTAAAGFFLYSYELESLNAPTTYVTDFTVSVPGRTAFDLDGDGSPETSAYCSDFCVIPNIHGAMPDEVVAIDDLVSFHFAFLERSTQLWIVSTHPPTTQSSTISAFGQLDITIDVVAPSATTAGRLSNVPVVWGSPTHSRLANLFGINLGASPGGDGYGLGVHFYTGARAGNAGTEAEGLYLYEYWFETGECAGLSLLVRGMDIPFESLVPFDVAGDGSPVTSFYMPYGTGGCGPATVADAVEIDGSLLSFDFPNGVAAGIANAYVISDLPPQEISGVITIEGSGSGPFRTWAAPEPGAMLAAGVALVALALQRRYSRG
jgi:hypothetical protein